MLMPKTIKTKISLAVAVVIIVIAAIQLYFQDQQFRHYAENTVNHYIESMSQASAKGIQNWLEPRFSIIQQVKEWESANETQLIEHLAQARDSGQFLSVYIGTVQGEMIRSNGQPSKLGYDPRQRPWYRLAMQSPNTVVTAPYQDSATGKPVVTIAQQFKRSNGDKAVVAGDISIEQLVSYIKSLSNNTAQAMLLDEQGTLLASVYNQLSLQSASQLSPQLSANNLANLSQAEHFSSMPLEAQTLLYQIHAIEGAPWYLLVAIDEHYAFSRVNDNRRQALLFTLVQVALVAGFALVIIARLLAPLEVILSAMKALAQGDLTTRVPQDSQDEIGKIAIAINHVAENLQHIVYDINRATGQISQGITDVKQQTAANQTVLAHHNGESGQIVDEVANMNDTVSSVADSASEALACTTQTTEQTEQSKQAVLQTVTSANHLLEEITAMEQTIITMRDDANNIASVLSLIGDIADQTNLLALNAAIEAARAGEQGRGFAVVADEVRALASRTQESTSEIATMLQKLNQGSEQAANAIENTKRSCLTAVENTHVVDEKLDTMRGSVKAIHQLNQQITTITDQQRQAALEINQRIQLLRDMAMQLKDAGQGTLDNVADLAQSNQQLDGAIRRFRI